MYNKIRNYFTNEAKNILANKNNKLNFSFFISLDVSSFRIKEEKLQPDQNNKLEEQTPYNIPTYMYTKYNTHKVPSKIIGN